MKITLELRINEELDERERQSMKLLREEHQRAWMGRLMSMLQPVIDRAIGRWIEDDAGSKVS